MCNTAQMASGPDFDAFHERVVAQRKADGQPPQITDPTLYRVLDGIMVGREGDPKQQASRRRI